MAREIRTGRAIGKFGQSVMTDSIDQTPPSSFYFCSLFRRRRRRLRCPKSTSFFLSPSLFLLSSYFSLSHNSCSPAPCLPFNPGGNHNYQHQKKSTIADLEVPPFRNEWIDVLLSLFLSSGRFSPGFYLPVFCFV